MGEIKNVLLDFLKPERIVCFDEEVLHFILYPEVNFMSLLVDFPVRFSLRLVGFTCSPIYDGVIRDRDVRYLECPRYI